MRDHGGNLDAAIARHGGPRERWIDLSTGINPRPYPLPPIPQAAWTALPTKADLDSLAEAAATAYGSSTAPLPVAGAQAAIQLVPLVKTPGEARVIGPTYNEHAAALAASGWRVAEVATSAELAGADLAVVVNPNNPDGQRHSAHELKAVAAAVDCLVVDESFAEATPGISLAGAIPDNAIVLRSFGKFYGLAGLRLGFVLAGARHRAGLRDLAGPWPVSGPAIAVGRTALADRMWREESLARLQRDATRLDALAGEAGWTLAGGTPLFRLFQTGDARGAQERLARAGIWSRRFPYSDSWLRLGLPDGAATWERLETALRPRPTGSL